jgi:hypothetical protein
MDKNYMNEVIARFWPKVDIPADVSQCWLWTAAKDKDGYGFIKIRVSDGPPPSFQNIRAHRFMWEFHHGPPPKYTVVMHSCDNPACVNPSHLSIGTDGDNMRDRDRKRRNSHGDRHPEAKLTSDDVREIRRLHATGNFTQVALAERFKVSCPAIWKIVHNYKWKHVE